ncbi:MAG: hypothetical protein J7M38_07910 [Armatimonadetes bacterium]|nr:hypothetical protein [Armatimonadota bacterium]
MVKLTRAMTFAIVISATAATAQEQPRTILRHDSFVAFTAEAGETVRFAVTSIQRGPAYGTLMRVSIINPDSDTVFKHSVPLNASEVITYTARVSGLHVARMQTGWNLGTIEVIGRPWALVAWQRVPVNICGHMRPQYFFVPQYMDRVRLALSASVTGEGALVRICDPDGKVVFEEEGDFDKERLIEIEAPESTRGKTWSVTLSRPKAQGLALDDVQLYLGRGLPPFLAEDPQWLNDFIGGEEYQPDDVERVIDVPGGGSIPRGGTVTLTWRMDELPEDRVYALRLTATDVDYTDEVPVSLNGGKTFYVPITGDSATETFTILIDRDRFVVGENSLKLGQNPEGGSNAVAVRDVQVLIGRRIREFLGW